MDLPTFYETAATVTLVLAAGTALAHRYKPIPRSRRGHAFYGLSLVLPPVTVVYLALAALAGLVDAQLYRLPVFLLVMFQLISGVAGTADMVRVKDEDREMVRAALRVSEERHRREKAERRKHRRSWWRPHSQPHKPQRTAPDEAAQTAAPDPATQGTGPNRTGRDRRSHS